MPKTAKVAFDLFGAGLEVVAPRNSWLDLFDGMLARFETSEAPSQAFRLVIREKDEPRIPAGVPMTWEGEFIERRAGRIYEKAAVEIVEVIGHGYVTIDYAAASAKAAMKPGSEAAFSFTPAMNILDASLKAAGKNLFHSASLVVPDGSGAIAVCAPSGFGKTTTSLALARGGFGLVSDDASVVEPHTDHLAIWGLPRQLKVHRRTAAMMPWIEVTGDEWNDEDEQAISLDTLRDQIAIAEPAPLPLRAVVLLGPRSDGDHRVTRLSKAEALIRIAQDNISNSANGVKAWNRRHFDAFAAMLRSAPAIQLSAGTAVDTLPAAVDAALAGISAD